MTEDGPQVDVTLNGEPRAISAGMALPELLRTIDIDPKEARGVAVAVNDSVVRREDWSEVTLRGGERVEVVTATQGG